MRKLLPSLKLLLRAANPITTTTTSSTSSLVPASVRNSPFLSRLFPHSSWHQHSLTFLASQFLSKQQARFRLLKVSFQKNNQFNAGRRLFASHLTSWRYMMPTPDGVLITLLGANVAVFLLWRIADPTFMRNHFMISLDNFKSGRVHTLLTSAFSHAQLDHLIRNMIGLYFFGASIGRHFGPDFLLKLYIAGALGGSAFFLLHKAMIASSPQGRQRWDYSRVPGLGASAAVNAIILLDVFLFPMKIYYVNLVIPVPAMLMGAIMIGTDLWRVKKGEGDVSGSAHLGGAVVAAIVWACIKRG